MYFDLPIRLIAITNEPLNYLMTLGFNEEPSTQKYSLFTYNVVIVFIPLTLAKVNTKFFANFPDLFF